MRCGSCEVVRINGLVCHESGCPESWRNTVRECDWCGSAVSERPRWGKTFCGESCAAAYFGLDEDTIDGEETVELAAV